MTREERAKQFMPFDAMKGLQEALRIREERHMRVEKRELSEEAAEKNSKALQMLSPGMPVFINYYREFHYVEAIGKITEINSTYRYLKLNDEKIFFDNIYLIENAFEEDAKKSVPLP